MYFLEDQNQIKTFMYCTSLFALHTWIIHHYARHQQLSILYKNAILSLLFNFLSACFCLSPLISCFPIFFQWESCIFLLFLCSQSESMLSVAMTNQKASFSLLRNSAIDSSSRNTTGSEVKQAASVVKNFTEEKSSL